MSDSTEGNFYALVIDDEPNVREYVAGVLQEEGWQVVQSASASEALGRADEPGWSAIFCSVSHGGANGYDVLRQFKEKAPGVAIVLVAGHGSATGTIDSTAYGAYDYLLKPFGPEELQSLARALRTQLSEPQSSSPTRRGAACHSDLELVGRSQAYFEVLKQLSRVSTTNLPVLLIGEAGTGKEVVASAIHQRSERRNQPFISVNCSSIPPDMIEASLFGYVRGAFPGANRDQRGLWEEANGGTLFINEITSTSLSLQDKLLRAWQAGEITRIGSDQKQNVNVRVIAASSRSVEKEVAAGRFRNDLFYRLGAVSIILPPLRERPEDIPPLAQSFADRVYRLNSRARFSTEALTLLTRYNWPGNIRELEQAVVCAVSLCDEMVQVKDLPQRMRDAQANGSAAEEWVTLSKIEGQYVARVLEHTGGNKQAAARVLAIDRKTLDRMIKRHHITPLHTRAHRAKASGN